MLQRKRGMHLPHGAVTCPGVGRNERQKSPWVDANQYSPGSINVVALRFHSVMIQSFRFCLTS